jgi:hypothetical protein
VLLSAPKPAVGVLDSEAQFENDPAAATRLFSGSCHWSPCAILAASPLLGGTVLCNETTSNRQARLERQPNFLWLLLYLIDTV